MPMTCLPFDASAGSVFLDLELSFELVLVIFVDKCSFLVADGVY